RPYHHPRLCRVLPGRRSRPFEPGPLLLRPRTPGAAPHDVPLPLSLPAGGHALPGRGHAPRGRVGLVFVGPVLGLGPQGELGPHRAPHVSRDPARALPGLDPRLRPRRGRAPRRLDGAHGLVRGELHPGHGPSLLRLRQRRVRLRRRVRGLRGGRHRGRLLPRPRGADSRSHPGGIGSGAGGPPGGDVVTRTVKAPDPPSEPAPPPLQSLVDYARLAPSTRNTQPWSFAVRGDEIRVFVDRDRWLRVADPDQRELYLSAGCALENLLVAGAHHGYKASVSYVEDDRADGLAAVARFETGGKAEDRRVPLFGA